MNVRLIAGKYKGRKLAAPTNSRTHPMGERIRNALFNSISSEINDAHVLDAFAGTGSIGFEALSRGAAHCTFIEKDRVALAILRENAQTLGATPQATITGGGVAPWAASYGGPLFDIIFADPPYNDVQFSTVLELFGLLKVGGLMVLSHPGRGEKLTKTGVVVVDNRSYGNAFLTFYRRVE